MGMKPELQQIFTDVNEFSTDMEEGKRDMEIPKGDENRVLIQWDEEWFEYIEDYKITELKIMSRMSQSK